MKNTINTTNPFNNESLNSYTLFTEQQVQNSLELADSCFSTWKKTSVSERTSLLSVLGDLLNKNKTEFSELMTLEMGKPISQSRAEIEKCITLCDFYETNAESFLADDIIETEAEESYISYDPLGTI